MSGDDRSLANLNRLVELVAPPATPVARGKPDAWVAVERELGTRLPDDFKAFVVTYGWGMFDEFLFVMTPFSRPGETLVDFGAGSMLEGLRGSRAAGVDIPYPLHPEPGGLLPWGYTANGDWCYWLTEPPDEPDRWRIVINGSRSDDYWEHPGPLTRALADLLSASVRATVFPDGFPGERLAFTTGPEP